MKKESGQLYIEGDRVRIRPWQHRDLIAQEMWPQYTEPFSTLWNTPRPISNGHFSRSQVRSSYTRYVWGVEDWQRRLIGRISLREVEEQLRQARLGISLGSPYVGQGLGTEALTLFLDNYFGPMGFVIMRLDVAAFNRRAVRCYERLGFHYMDSDWRYVGGDPSLHLLDDPIYSNLLTFFRRDRQGTWIQFFEMEIHRDQWVTRAN